MTSSECRQLTDFLERRFAAIDSRLDGVESYAITSALRRIEGRPG